MRKRHLAALTREYYGLRVEQLACTRGRVAHVAYRYVAFGKFFQLVARKHIGHKSHSLVVNYLIGIRNCYAAAFLTPVLEREKSVVNGMRDGAVLR